MSFPKQVFLTLLTVGVLASYPLYKYGNKGILLASVVGTTLATVNVLFGYMAIERSFNKSATVFLKVVLGGMGIRMFVLAGIFLLLIKLAGLYVPALVGSMGIFYAIYLTLEVLYINKKVSVR